MADEKAELKILEALKILADLEMPTAQQNERSALTLLALCNMSPEKDWKNAEQPLLGITPMMDWFKINYNKDYKPNTRETVRRQTVHQFVAAGLARYNPDCHDRPVNSPKAVYQLAPETLSLLKTFGTGQWPDELSKFLKIHKSLASQYANDRDMAKVPLTIKNGLSIKLSPGDHSQLIKDIIGEFGPRFAPGSRLVYVGDTGEKWGYADEELLGEFGIPIAYHGKMPDVVLYDQERNWLFLIEAVTSHGPVDGKRIGELTDRSFYI